LVYIDRWRPIRRVKQLTELSETFQNA